MRRAAWWAVGFAVAVAGVSPVSAAPVAAASLSYIVSGTVTDAASGGGVSGICVRVSPIPGFEWDAPVWSTTTGPSGLYQLTVPAYVGNGYAGDGSPEPYYVYFTDCRSKRVYLDQWWDGAPDSSTATAIYLSASQPTALGTDAALQAGGWILGRLVDARTGAPLNGIGVSATVPGNSSPSTQLGTVTDAKGNYALGPLPTEDYNVYYEQCCAATASYAAQYYDQQPGYAAAQLVPVVAPKKTRLADEPMSIGGILTGDVTDAATGAPIAGVAVVAVRSDGATYGETWTAADGTYRLNALYAGTYTVRFDRSGYTTQYYADQTSANTATPVNVAFYSATDGVNAALQPSG